MSTLEKINQIMKSDIDDDLKMEVISLIMNANSHNEKTVQNPTPKDVWDDSGWWQQQLMNGQADADSIIHPPFTYTSVKFNNQG